MAKLFRPGEVSVGGERLEAWCGRCERGGCYRCHLLASESAPQTDRRRSVTFEVGQVLHVPPGRMTMHAERAVVVRIGESSVDVVCDSDGGRRGFAPSSVCARECSVAGLQLPDGRRVLVGERYENATTAEDGRRLWGEPFSVTAVLPGGQLELVGPHEVRIDAALLLDSLFGWVRVGELFGVGVHLPLDLPDMVVDEKGDVAGGTWERLPRERARQAVRTLPTKVAAYDGSGYPDRTAVDALLREDARQCPAFAAARRAALLGFVENREARGRPVVHAGSELLAVLYACERYEGLRGGMSAPRPEAIALAGSHADDLRAALGVYERARSAG